MFRFLLQSNPWEPRWKIDQGATRLTIRWETPEPQESSKPEVMPRTRRLVEFLWGCNGGMPRDAPSKTRTAFQMYRMTIKLWFWGASYKLGPLIPYPDSGNKSHAYHPNQQKWYLCLRRAFKKVVKPVAWEIILQMLLGCKGFHSKPEFWCCWEGWACGGGGERLDFTQTNKRPDDGLWIKLLMDLAREGTGDGPKCLGFAELFLQTVGCLPGFFGPCRRALECLVSGKARGVSLKQVWCLLFMLFIADPRTVSEINNRCA